MNVIEVNHEISEIIAIFQCFGFWQIPENASSKWIKLFILCFCATGPVTFGASAFLNGNKDESVFLAAVSTADVVFFVKLFFIIWRKSEILALIQQINSLRAADQNEVTQVNVKVKTFLKYSKYLVMMVVFTMNMFFVGVAVEKSLPFKIAFPLDWEESEVGYWLAFAYLSLLVIFGSAILLLNILIWYFMLSFSIEYEVLGNQLTCIGKIKNTETIIPVEPKYNTVEKLRENPNLFLRHLFIGVKRHRNIRETINQFQSCFSNLFFIQIVTSGMSICGSVYTLAFNSPENVFLFTYYVLLFLYNIFDIFTITYLGNEIKISSNRLSYRLFESNWMAQTKSCKMSVILFTEIIKQPQELVVGVLYPLNLETFSRILHLAYSMFNILRNLN